MEFGSSGGSLQACRRGGMEIGSLRGERWSSGGILQPCRRGNFMGFAGHRMENPVTVSRNADRRVGIEGWSLEARYRYSEGKAYGSGPLEVWRRCAGVAM